MNRVADTRKSTSEAAGIHTNKVCRFADHHFSIAMMLAGFTFPPLRQCSPASNAMLRIGGHSLRVLKETALLTAGR
jgi:hypothetical protein